uniref:GTPase-activating protein gyp7-like isoform X2 n=1 Tax=Rhizophora mucronata TaxID=61149 RepID=A0A2P2IW52_RHIMU
MMKLFSSIISVPRKDPTFSSSSEESESVQSESPVESSSHVTTLLSPSPSNTEPEHLISSSMARPSPSGEGDLLAMSLSSKPGPVSSLQLIPTHSFDLKLLSLCLRFFWQCFLRFSYSFLL